MAHETPFSDWRTPALLARLAFLQALDADPSVGDNFFRAQDIGQIQREIQRRNRAAA